MQQFEGRLAVITGGGTGMGRELARLLAAEGCHLALCDVSEEEMARTQSLCEQAAAGIRVSTHLADVSDEAQVGRFAGEVARAHQTDQLHLLFNNAGIGGGGSFVLGEREEWDKTFAVCWNGVYFCTRAFLPMLMASPEGHLVNTSSVNGFWASLGPLTAHTAYSAAKFAVKGFSEALVNDFRVNAPHLKVSLVMPGHVGTSIVINSGRILGRDPKEMPDELVETAREQMARLGFEVTGASPDEIRQALQQRAEEFRDEAPLSAAEAAKIILDGVRADRWRILVGRDAEAIDEMVREAPEEAYETGFMQRLVERTGWSIGS
jgi:NAD(P)-dependent dehydrogenase (short-subunit alcohol dehydrogenase family)